VNSEVKPNPLAGFEMRDGVFNLRVNEKIDKISTRVPKTDEDGAKSRLIHSAGLTAVFGREWPHSKRLNISIL